MTKSKPVAPKPVKPKPVLAWCMLDSNGAILPAYCHPDKPTVEDDRSQHGWPRSQPIILVEIRPAPKRRKGAKP